MLLCLHYSIVSYFVSVMMYIHHVTFITLIIFYKVLVAYSCDIICNDLGVEAYKFILLIYLFSRLYKYYQVAVPFMKLLCNYISCVSCVYNYLCL